MPEIENRIGLNFDPKYIHAFAASEEILARIP